MERRSEFRFWNLKNAWIVLHKHLLNVDKEEHTYIRSCSLALSKKNVWLEIQSTILFKMDNNTILSIMSILLVNSHIAANTKMVFKLFSCTDPMDWNYCKHLSYFSLIYFTILSILSTIFDVFLMKQLVIYVFSTFENKPWKLSAGLFIHFMTKMVTHMCGFRVLPPFFADFKLGFYDD